MFVVRCHGAIRMTGHATATATTCTGSSSTARHVLGAQLNLLASRPSFVDGHRRGKPRGHPHLDSDGLHSALVSEAVLGEKIMRALILRRVGLHRVRRGWPGARGRRLAAGRDAAARVPHAATAFRIMLLDPRRPMPMRARSSGATRPRRPNFPLVICADGTMLRNPTEVELARCTRHGGRGSHSTRIRRRHRRRGTRRPSPPRSTPPRRDCRSWCSMRGRSAARREPARASRNYFGFPTGISGLALDGTRVQPGAEIRRAHRSSPRKSLDHDATSSRAAFTRFARRRHACWQPHGRRRQRRALSAGPARARAAARWKLARRAFWALAHRGEDVRRAGSDGWWEAEIRRDRRPCSFRRAWRKVWMLVRSQGLASEHVRSTSSTGSTRTPNIELLTRTSIVAAGGTFELPRARFRHVEHRDLALTRSPVRWRRASAAARRPIRHLFLFIGADPSNT